MSKTAVSRIIFLILILVALAFLVLSFVALGGANDAYAKYPDGKKKSFTSLQLHLSSSSLQSSQSLIELLISDEKSEDDLVSEGEEEAKEEEEEEEEENELEKAFSLIFFFHYTTAAVCFSISVVLSIIAFIFKHIVSGSSRDSFKDHSLCSVFAFRPFENGGCSYLWLLCAIPLVLVPAFRMDEFTTVTYWIFFIPYLLVALALPVVFFRWVCPDTEQIRCEMFIINPLGYFLVLTGLILWILRLDNVLPASFKYTYVFIFPAAGLFVVLIPVVEDTVVNFRVMAEGDDYEGFHCGPGVVLCDVIPSLVIALVVYGGFFLPFLLRKDLIFLSSYHFTFIPYYIIILGCVIYAFFVSFTGDFD